MQTQANQLGAPPEKVPDAPGQEHPLIQALKEGAPGKLDKEGALSLQNNKEVHPYLQYLRWMKQKQAIAELFNATGLPEDKREAFETRARLLTEEFILTQRRHELEKAGRVLRDYRPREGFMNWLRAEDGAKDWYEAGLITLPFLRHNAPKAYEAYLNQSRKSAGAPCKLPKLPNVSDLISEKFVLLGVDPTSIDGIEELERLAYTARSRLRAHEHNRS